MFSTTGRSASSFTCWNVRATPSAAIRRGGRLTAGFPNRLMRPSLGDRTPLIMLNSVVLPAPFGPMSPTTSPAWTEKLVSRTAARPAKLRDTVCKESNSSPAAPCA